jgi:hypothetical protein
MMAERMFNFIENKRPSNASGTAFALLAPHPALRPEESVPARPQRRTIFSCRKVGVKTSEVSFLELDGIRIDPKFSKDATETVLLRARQPAFLDFAGVSHQSVG